MQELIVSLMEQYGYGGIFFLIALENIFPPIPSEVILTFGGFLTTYTSLEVPGVVAAATFGSLAGAAVLYGAGMLLNKERLKKIVSGRAGKLLGLKAGDVEKGRRLVSENRHEGCILLPLRAGGPQSDLDSGGNEPHEASPVLSVYGGRFGHLEYPSGFPGGLSGRILGIYCLSGGRVFPHYADYLKHQRGKRHTLATGKQKTG